jgi:hypothetical protein
MRPPISAVPEAVEVPTTDPETALCWVTESEVVEVLATVPDAAYCWAVEPAIAIVAAAQAVEPERAEKVPGSRLETVWKERAHAR